MNRKQKPAHCPRLHESSRAIALLSVLLVGVAIGGMGVLWPVAARGDNPDSPDQSVPPPPSGLIYHGVFPGSVAGDLGEEDSLTLEDLRSYEERVGKSAAWVYFSHNWFRRRSFPWDTASWIRDAGSVPYIRLMLRSSEEQDVAEPTFTLERIIDGDFDDDLHAWAGDARDFGSPLIVEYGTEVNGEWFSWNGVWNGADELDGYGEPAEYDGPERFRDAYRHIIQIARDEGASNITWVFHVDGSDVPDEEWNSLENYYPGDEWIDWLGVSVYGAGDPMDDEWVELREGMDEVYPRLAALSPNKPIVLLEFGVTSGNPLGDQAEWTEAALTDIVALRWPRLIGFSWWNEKWENDDDPSHNTNMRVQDNPDLAAVFQRLVGDEPKVLGNIHWPAQTMATDEPTAKEPAPTTPSEEEDDDDDDDEGEIGSLCPASVGLALVGLVLGQRWASGGLNKTRDLPRRQNEYRAESHRAQKTCCVQHSIRRKKMSTKRIWFIVLIASAAMLVVGISPRFASARHAPPSVQKPTREGVTIPYPGRLDDETGQPVSDGAYDLAFALYDAETGGKMLWSEVQEGVMVEGGALNVLLGGAQPIPTRMLDGDVRWLAVGVRGPREVGFADMAPRQRLSPNAPAAQASPAAGLACEHDHLGETWTGSDNTLVITGTFGTVGTAFAPLALGNSAFLGIGLRVLSAGSYGVHVDSAGADGVYVASAGHDGVVVSSAGEDGVNVSYADNDGVVVFSAGNPSAEHSSTQKNGFEVAGAEGDGLHVGRADDEGVYVGSTGGTGVAVSSAGGTGVYVASAGNDGVFANTARANHEWGFYTPDKIYAGTTTSGGPLMLVAQNGDQHNLEAGDVVAVGGTGAPFADSEFPVPLVQKAGGSSSAAIVGVVYRRFVGEEKFEEVERDSTAERETSIHTHSTEGPIAPGDYLLIVVVGPAQVKADAVPESIRPGDLLSASGGGQAMKAAPVEVGGVEFYAPGTIVGKAMESLDVSRPTGLIWVLVMPQ